jgi:hyperosmotically inducible periplasmic protein
MKQITLSLLCVCVFTLSAIAQDKPAADSAKKNERDRSGETRTSGDQSNSPEDVKITATIRRAIVKDHSLSATAKNMKIITADGTVTLRGPVKNEAEKTKLLS